MIPKGTGDIRGIFTINTRPGPMTEKDVVLRLYKLASQKANFQKKKEWAERQRTQAIRHLIDVQRRIGPLKKLLKEQKEDLANPNPESTSRKKKWSELKLEY